MPYLNSRNEYTNYDKKLKPKKYFQTKQLKKLYSLYKTQIFKSLKKETLIYLQDNLLCNDEPNMFPKKSRLTGEYYISSIDIYKLNNHIILSIKTNFLGFYKYKQTIEIDDYLELEVSFIFKNNYFIPYEINSSVI